MAESGEKPEATPAGGDETLAAALALGPRRRNRTRAKGPSPEETFLGAESRKLELEMHHLRLQHFDQRLSIGLKLMTLGLGLLIALGIAAMSWVAFNDRGLVVTAFSAPPDVAQKGLNGQVLAGQLIDDLERLQSETRSARPAATYVDGWGEDIKVEIPETGISIGELQRALTRVLGHETRISGALYRTPQGLALTVRAGANAGQTFEGPEDKLGDLMRQAADSVYRQTQPYRYAAHLSATGKLDEAKAIFAALAAGDGSDEDRAWAYLGWATVLSQQGDLFAAAEKGRISARLYPQAMADTVVAAAESELDHEEAAVQSDKAIVRVLERDPPAYLSPTELAAKLAVNRAHEASWLSDAREAERQWRTVPFIYVEGQEPISTLTSIAGALAAQHDAGGALRLIQQATSESNPHFTLPINAAREFAHEAIEDWPAARDDWLAVQAQLIASGPAEERLLARNIWAPMAYVYAQLGQFETAEALIAKTPLDCDQCVRERGNIAAAKHDWAAAGRWFAQVSHAAPSLPSGPTDWGRMLLMKGDPDGAMDQFREAHRRSPHFADPVELWGEALIRKGDFAGAVTKFAAAEPDAPRWGRLHMKWGEALALLGKHDLARAQLVIAAHLDLSSADRSELSGQRL